MNILVLVGSLRVGSFTKAVAHTAAAQAQARGMDVTVAEHLDALPFFNQDLEEQPGREVEALREAVTAADALLVLTPEYNGSIPAVLKNAIDWLSRPHGVGAISGKPAAVMGVSPSPRGAQWAAEDARKVLGVAGADVVEEVRLIGQVNRKVAEGVLSGDDDIATVALAVEGLRAKIGALQPA